MATSLDMSSVPDAATGSSTKLPPSKKQRKSNNKRTNNLINSSSDPISSLPGFRKLPVELLAEILLYTKSPRDVLAVARCSKYHCDTLMNAGNQYIWKYTRQHCKPAPLPDPPKRFTEAAYAAFLFDEGVCEECKTPVKEMMDSFGLRLRLSRMQNQVHVVSIPSSLSHVNPPRSETNNSFLPSGSSTILMHNPAVMESHQTFIETLPMLEASNCLTGSGLSVKHYPEVSPVYRSSQWVSALQDYLEASRTPETYQKYVEECSIKAEWNIDFLKFCANLYRWKVQYQKAYQDNKQFNLQFATNLALKHGQTQLDFLSTPTYGVIHRNRLKILEHMREEDYTNHKEVIDSELLSLRERRTRQANAKTHQITRDAIEKHYNRLRATKQLLPLPTLETFRQLPIMRQLQTSPRPHLSTGATATGTPGNSQSTSPSLEATLDNSLKSPIITSLLTSQLAEWRESVKSSLAQTLGFPKDWKSADPRKLHPVDRVTARFICGGVGGCGRISMAFKEDECLDFVGVCGHVCSRPSSGPGSEGKKEKKKEKPFNGKRFVKDEKAINAMNKVLNACGISDDDPLSLNELENIKFRILCTSCDARIVMDVNSVIGHSHRHSDMQLVLVSSAEAEVILKPWPGMPSIASIESQRGLTVKFLGSTSGSKDALALKMKKGYGCRHCLQGPHQLGEQGKERDAVASTSTTTAGAGAGTWIGTTASATASATTADTDVDTSAPAAQAQSQVQKSKKPQTQIPTPAGFTFDGLRCHLKEKHKVESVRDEDYFYSDQLKKACEENEARAKKRREKEKEKKQGCGTRLTYYITNLYEDNEHSHMMRPRPLHLSNFKTKDKPKMQFLSILRTLSAFLFFAAVYAAPTPLRVVNKLQFGGAGGVGAGGTGSAITTTEVHARQAAAQAAGTVTCTNKAQQLSSHDCNVALLSLGPGGIAGAIQFLRPNTASVTATSGGCTVSAATTDGSIIDVSKGRLEHGGVKGFDNLLDECGATPGTVLVQGGATGGGNLLVTISAA
ncbi:hypothetical protein D9758_003510 [Tetrapyrgos nigripes]|uniref:F-box domain-containing protein n=1 Tax=Tetrapyrgos nigripes TaxID=182062 RepID=A0A8H5LVZ2_9AGAR|nr:hypothetical protein D9758_003510 [Tetrapyrgos nigripes]